MSVIEPEVIDPRSARSMAALLEAATSLIDSGAMDATITDVVALAGTSRPTFYQHFGDLPTLQRAAARARLDAAYAPVRTPDYSSPTWPQDLHTEITGLLERLHAHAPFYTRVLDGPASSDAFEDAVSYIAERMLGTTPRTALGGEPLAPHAARFLAAGAAWLFRDWLRHDHAEPASLVADRIITLMLNGAGLGATRP